ncbi:MAG TPA: NAD-dependent epimerase/dehydratase family protein [Labilithrix sp.]|nr:NAD-dependent epimerase/dehydratase family protein [Labilithrix sp.]
MQRILVVGGAGVVGSHLVDRLLAEGNEVVAVDDLSRGSFANVAHLRRSPRFAFIEHDVAAPYRAGVDAVFHLAVPSTRTACEHDGAKAMLTCVLGTKHTLSVAADNGARLVLATATERWGDGVRCAESLAVDFARTRGTDVRIVRVPSAYGPRMAPDGGHLVASLVLQALRGTDLSAGARLDRRVRLAYVDDVVETLVRTMGSAQHTPAIVAPSAEVSVLDLAHLVAEAAGLVGVEVTDEPIDGPSSRPPSVRPTLAEALPASIALGLSPSVSLAEGIARTVAWFERRAPRRRCGEERRSGVYERGAAAPLPASATRAEQGERRAG